MVFLPASAQGTPWSFLKKMTSQDVSDSRSQSPERGLSDGEEGPWYSRAGKQGSLGLAAALSDLAVLEEEKG